MFTRPILLGCTPTRSRLFRSRPKCQLFILARAQGSWFKLSHSNRQFKPKYIRHLWTGAYLCRWPSHAPMLGCAKMGVAEKLIIPDAAATSGPGALPLCVRHTLRTPCLKLFSCRNVWIKCNLIHKKYLFIFFIAQILRLLPLPLCSGYNTQVTKQRLIAPFGIIDEHNGT